jgi:hypothetical protein
MKSDEIRFITICSIFQMTLTSSKTIFKRGLSGLLLVVAIFAGYTYYENILPNPTPLPLPVMPSPNARDAFDKAEKLEKDSGIVSFACNPTPHGPPPPRLSTAVDGGWHTFTLAEKEHLVNENMPSLSIMKFGRSQQYMNQQMAPQMSDIEHNLADYSFADLFILHAQVDEDHGNWQEAMNSCLNAIRFGCDLEYGDSMRGEWVGDGCEDKARREIRGDVIIDHLSLDELKSAALTLYKINANENPIANTIQEDEWVTQDEMRSYKNKGFWIEYIQIAADPSRSFEKDGSTYPYIAFSECFPRRTYAFYTQYTNALIRNTAQPWGLQQGTLSPVVPKEVICEVKAYIYKKARYGRVITFALSRLLDVQLSLRAYYLDNRHYPSTLSDLIPQYIPSIPLDPFSSNQPLKYRLSGKTYTLYSIGPDAIDDGGRPMINTVSRPGIARSSAFLHNPFFMPFDAKGDIVAGGNN